MITNSIEIIQQHQSLIYALAICYFIFHQLCEGIWQCRRHNQNSVERSSLEVCHTMLTCGAGSARGSGWSTETTEQNLRWLLTAVNFCILQKCSVSFYITEKLCRNLNYFLASFATKGTVCSTACNVRHCKLSLCTGLRMLCTITWNAVSLVL